MDPIEDAGEPAVSADPGLGVRAAEVDEPEDAQTIGEVDAPGEIGGMEPLQVAAATLGTPSPGEM